MREEEKILSLSSELQTEEAKTFLKKKNFYKNFQRKKGPYTNVYYGGMFFHAFFCEKFVVSVNMSRKVETSVLQEYF